MPPLAPCYKMAIFFQQRAITPKWLILELWHLDTALRLIAFYMHTKFKVNRFMGFEVMLRTNTIWEYFFRIKGHNSKMAYPRVMALRHCTPSHRTLHAYQV